MANIDKRDFRQPDSSSRREEMGRVFERVVVTMLEAEQLLEKPHDPRRQAPIESRFRSSAGRIQAIDNIETELSEGHVRSEKAREAWEGDRDFATSRGYQIKTYVEYTDGG